MVLVVLPVLVGRQRTKREAQAQTRTKVAVVGALKEVEEVVMDRRRWRPTRSWVGLVVGLVVGLARALHARGHQPGQAYRASGRALEGRA